MLKSKISPGGFTWSDRELLGARGRRDMAKNFFGIPVRSGPVLSGLVWGPFRVTPFRSSTFGVPVLIFQFQSNLLVQMAVRSGLCLSLIYMSIYNTFT